MAGASDEERRLHARLLARDPVAPSDLMNDYLAAITRRLLRERQPGPDTHAVEDAAIDALMSYAERPQQYDPEKLPLPSFLLMSAHADLKNLERSEARHIHGALSYDDSPMVAVEVSLVAGKDSVEAQAIKELEMDLPGEISRDEALRALQMIGAEFPQPADRRILALQLDGERRTERFAQVMGILDLPPAEQRRLVKQAKDRIDKRVQRLRARVRKGEGTNDEHN